MDSEEASVKFARLWKRRRLLPVLALVYGLTAFGQIASADEYLQEVTQRNSFGETEIITTFKMDGTAREKVKEEAFYHGGRKKLERNFEKGKLHGKVIGWYESLGTAFDADYLNGVVSGVYRAWYQSGNARELSEWRDGKRQGHTILWDMSGDSVVSDWDGGKIVNGEFVVQWADQEKTINEQGSIVLSYGRKTMAKTFLNGVGVKVTSWHPNGRKKNETELQNDHPHGTVREWDLEGRLVSLSSYANGKLDGSSVRWRSAGETWAIFTYRQGQKDGVFAEWYPTGIKKEESYWENGQLHGPMTRWYETGETLSVTPYARGQLHGTATYWYRSGITYSESIWENGNQAGAPVRWDDKGKRIDDEVYAFEDLNFKIGKPKKPWVKFDDAKSLNAEGTIAFIRANPTLTFFLVAEDAGMYAITDVNALTEIALGNVKSRSERFTLHKKEPFTKNGISGTRVEFEIEQKDLRIYYVAWFVAQNGFVYQFYVFGTPADKRELNTEFEKFARSFTLIDPARVSDKAPENLVKKYASRAFGYSIDSLTQPWIRSKEIEEKFPAADIGLISLKHGSFFVSVAACLYDFSPDFQDLTATLLTMLGRKYPAAEFKTPRKFQLDGADGVEFLFETPLGDHSAVCRIRIVHKGRRAYAAMSIVDKGDYDDMKETIDEIFSSINYGPGQADTEEPSLTDDQRRANGLVLNDLGIQNFNAKKMDKALALFLKSFESNPEKGVVLANVISAYIEMKRYEDALDFLDTNLPRFQEDWDLRRNRAFLLAALKRWEESADAYRQVVDHAPPDEKLSMDYANVLWNAGKKDAAFKLIKDMMKKTGTPASGLFLARMHRDNKDYDAAVEVLEQILKEYPDNSQILGDLVETHFLAGAYAKSLDDCEKLIACDPKAPVGYYLKGRNELSLKRFRDAKVSIEKAFELNPYDMDVKELLNYVSGILGQGENSALKSGIEPVKFAAQFEIGNVLSQRPDPVYIENQNAYYGLDVKAIEYRKGAEFKKTARWIIKILNQEGVGEFGELTYDFDPLYQQACVNHLIVYDGKGTKVTEGNVDNFYMVDQKRDVASQDKEIHMPVPGLASGYTIDFMVTVKSYSADRFVFDRQYMTSRLPVLEKYYAVSGTVSDLVYTSKGMDDVQAKEDALIFRKRSPDVIHVEEYLPPLDEFLPYVHVASRTTWKDEVNRYHQQLAEFYQVDAEIAGLAKSLTESCTSSLDRIQTLSRHVRSNLHYKAISFGPRARIPNPAVKTLQQKYGDCKDLSILLYGMLKAVGVKSYPVLVHSSERIDTGIPTLDQFDHMIIAADGGDSPQYIDCTQKYQSEHYFPIWLGGKWALPIFENNDQLYRLPESTGTGVLRIERETNLDEQLRLTVSETVTLDGYVRDLMRDQLASFKKAEWVDKISAFLGKASGDFSMVDFNVSGFESPEDGLTMKIKFLLDKEFMTTSGNMVGKIPAFWEKNYISISKLNRRRNPFWNAYPLEVQTDVIVHLPENYELKNPDILARKRVDDKYILWEYEGRVEGDQIRLRASFQIPRAGGAPDEYEPYRQKLEEGVQALSEKLVLKRK